VYKVRYTNNDVWGLEPWENAAGSKGWTLTSGEGTKYVSYQIKDKAGLISDTYWDSIFLDVNDPPTVSAISGPTSGYRDTEYTWTASGSDPDGDSLTYEWTVDGTGVSGSSSMEHTFDSGDALGAHTIKVRVKDSNGAYSGYQTLTFTLTDVPNDPPTISEITGPDGAYIGDTCTFTASATDPDNNLPITITWYINDATQTTGTSFVYTFDTEAAGEYTIKARAHDSKGASSGYVTLAFYLNENSPPTISEITGPENGTKGVEYSFNVSATDEDGDDLTYEWKVDE
jgi:hypothetical protein